MKKRKRFFSYIIISILSVMGLALFANTFPPHVPIELFGFRILSTVPFFLLFFLILASLGTFVFVNFRRGLFIGLFSIGLLYLQYIRYNNIFYTVVLVLIFALIEYLFWKKK